MQTVTMMEGRELGDRTGPDAPMRDGSFRALTWLFVIRDAVGPRGRILDEVDLRPDQVVLEYGCGPGGYTLVVAERVGPGGTVHALDIHPLAVERVGRLAARRGLGNVRTILSDRRTGLPDGSVDVVLFYDVLHDLGDPEGVLAELHRVLRPGGVLSVSDHHLSETRLIHRVMAGGRFVLDRRGRFTFTFLRT